jgi:hypothetical protein
MLHILMPLVRVAREQQYKTVLLEVAHILVA